MEENVRKGFAQLRLFSGVPQLDNFCRMAEIRPSFPMAPSTQPKPWPVGHPLEPPGQFEWLGQVKDFEEVFVDTETVALLMLHQGKIRYERYALTGGRDVRWLSMSVAKSFVSALVGVALDDGDIGSIEDPISKYVEVPAESAYDGVSIRDVLHMASGARWNEDYSDPSSDARRLGRAMSGHITLEEFIGTMSPELPPGTVCRYNSGDTQALAQMLVRATGQPLAQYMQEKLCEPLGFTSSAAWLTDRSGMEAAFAFLNLTARDFARLGELYRNGGRVGGVQVVPEQWVVDSIADSAPPQEEELGTDERAPLGYGYQWWIPRGNNGEFTAIGVYNQFVYVDPSREVVIVKLSANRRYGTSPDEEDNREGETIEFLRALAREVD